MVSNGLPWMVEIPDLNHVHSTFLATVLKVVYGVGLTEDHDKYAETFNISAEGIAQGLVPGKYIVDLLPFLKDVPKWVPGFSWQADFERWRTAVQQVKDVPFAHTKEAMVRSSSSLPRITDNKHMSIPTRNVAKLLILSLPRHWVWLGKKTNLKANAKKWQRASAL